MKDIVIIGAGGHAKVILDILLKRKELLNEKINILGFLDDNFKNLDKKEIFGFPILGNISLIEKLKEESYFVIAIGDNLTRKKISQKYQTIKLLNIIHPSSIIGINVQIGKGTVVMANTTINSFTIIKENVIINTGAIIEHDNVIESYVHISPGVILCGGVKVEENSWIGAGSIIKPNIKIGKNVIIGAGTVVIGDIEDNCTVVGNPAKVIKRNEYEEK